MKESRPLVFDRNQNKKRRFYDNARLAHEPRGCASIDATSALGRLVLASKQIETKSGNQRNAIVRDIANNLQQLSRAIAALGRDDAELGHIPADCIRQHRALPYQQLSGLVQHQAGLLFRFYRNKPHRRPRHGLTDRRRIVGVILAALEIGLNTIGTAAATARLNEPFFLRTAHVA
jgi:acyl-CoA reductase-like NAD-dependent aldehyde dehydrogenase